MKIIINNSTLNPESVTYGELKANLPSTAGQKIPTAAQLSEEGTVFFAVRDEKTLLTVYTSGFLTFTQPDETSRLRTTVTAVDRCNRMVYRFFCSKEEYEDDWEAPEGCSIAYRFEKGSLVKLQIIPEATYRDFHWLIPVSHICEERLLRNGHARERSRFAFSFDEEGQHSEWAMREMDKAWAAEKKEAEQKRRELELLEKAKESLTDIQRRTVDLYFRAEGTPESAVAELLGTSQQNVHKNLAAALKKMRTFFERNGC